MSEKEETIALLWAFVSLLLTQKSGFGDFSFEKFQSWWESGHITESKSGI